MPLLRMIRVKKIMEVSGVYVRNLSSSRKDAGQSCLR